MIQLRRVSPDEFPTTFEVTAHALDRSHERLSKRRLKTIGNVEEYLKQVALEGQVWTPGTFRHTEHDPGPCFNYTKTDGKVVVAVVVPLNDDQTLAQRGYVTTMMLKSEGPESRRMN